MTQSLSPINHVWQLGRESKAALRLNQHPRKRSHWARTSTAKATRECVWSRTLQAHKVRPDVIDRSNEIGERSNRPMPRSSQRTTVEYSWLLDLLTWSLIW